MRGFGLWYACPSFFAMFLLLPGVVFSMFGPHVTEPNTPFSKPRRTLRTLLQTCHVVSYLLRRSNPVEEDDFERSVLDFVVDLISAWRASSPIAAARCSATHFSSWRRRPNFLMRT